MSLPHHVLTDEEYAQQNGWAVKSYQTQKEFLCGLIFVRIIGHSNDYRVEMLGAPDEYITVNRFQTLLEAMSAVDLYLGSLPKVPMTAPPKKMN